MATTKSILGVHVSIVRVWTTLHHGLALIGLVAMLVLFSQTGRLIPSEASGASASFGTIRYEGDSLFNASDASTNPRYRALAVYLSRRYRVASDATERLVSAAYEAGQQIGVDPLLILAVMGIESSLNPIAESVVGAKGLMQVIPRYHQEKFEAHGGADSVLDPMTNILVGASILKEYIRRAGSLEAGLQIYAGAQSDESSLYSRKVIAEKARLERTFRQSRQLAAAT